MSLAYTQTNLTDNGAEWRNEITLGDDKQLASEWYQPLTQSQDWYFKSRYQFDRRYQGLFEDNDLTLGVDWRIHEIRTGLGYNLSHNAFSELGIRGLTGRIYNRALSHRPYQVRGYGGYLQLGYDRLNSISFPTQGDRLTFEVQFGHENLFQRGDESNANFRTKYKLDWKGALNYRHQTLVGKLALETAQHEVDQLSGEPAELGGFLNLSGFHKNSLLGNHKIFGALQYQYDLGRDLLGLTSYPLYLGVSAEAGNVWLNRDDVELSDLIYSSSLYLGTDTQFGPAALAFGYTDEGDRALYLFVGKNF